MSDVNGKLCGHSVCKRCCCKKQINGELYGICDKWVDITNCRLQKKHPCFVEILPKRKIPKVIPKYSSNSYHFQGPINFKHLCNDCLKDGKFSFLAISNEVLYFGFSRQIPQVLVEKYVADFTAERVRDTYYPFHIFSCKKSYTTLLIDRLKNTEKEIKKSGRKIAKTLYKDKQEGKFSNQLSTKVMTF